MGIDIKNETLINLVRAARLLPAGRNGKPVHVSTIVREITKGKNGIKLEGLRIGNRWVTSIEAMQRWAEARSRSRAAPGRSHWLSTPS